MATWPEDGDTNWNTKMLAYLAVEHNTDGTHKATELTTIVTGEGIFGTRTANDSESNSLVKNEIYKVGSDGYVTFIHSQGNEGHLYFYSDSSSTPTTLLGRLHGDWGLGYWSSCFPIKKDDYWKITYASTGDITDIRWLPIGSGTCVKQ